MSVTLGLRPRLLLDVPGTADELVRRIQDSASVYRVSVAGSYLVVEIPTDQQHYWSPHLQIALEDRDGTVHVDGLITPMPAVWTLFATAYGAILVLGFFGAIYGLAQFQLGQPATGLWSVPLTLLLLGAVYGAARIGQHVGHEQTEALTAFLEQCLQVDREP